MRSWLVGLLIGFSMSISFARAHASIIPNLWGLKGLALSQSESQQTAHSSLLEAATSPSSESASSTVESAGNRESLRDLYAQNDKKKRVPKEKKDDSKKDDDDDEDEDDGPCASIFGECLLDMLSSSSDEEEQEVSVAQTTVFPEPMPLREPPIGTDLIIQPEDPGVLQVDVWNAPGAEEGGAVAVDKLERGTWVRLTGTAEIEGTSWYSVSPSDSTLSSGWVESKYINLSPVMVEEPILLPFEESEPAFPYERPTWQFTIDVAVAGLELRSEGPREEYDKGGFFGGVGVRYFLGGPFYLAADYHFSTQDGDPGFNYVYPDSAQIDIPYDSGIQTHQFHLLPGIEFPVENGQFVINWGIGPSLIRVREHAKINWAATGGTTYRDGE
jgi:hypothetical protein